MASIRAITAINARTAAFALIGALLIVFASINLVSSPTPLADANAVIADNLTHSGAVAADRRMAFLAALRQEQEAVLARKPAEPFAWARLAYLRLATENDAQGGFNALRMSDLVSPNEPRQLPERALMWRQFGAVENEEQRAYQTELWQKAYALEGDATWDIALKNGLTGEVSDALAKGDPEQYQEWQARMAALAPTPATPAVPTDNIVNAPAGR